MRTAVVTGATGFIGMALTKQLVASGIKVYAIGRDVNILDQLSKLGNVFSVSAGYEQYNSLAKLIPEKVDVFYHCAFKGGFSGTSLKNYSLQLENVGAACDAVMSAVDLCAEKFVLASTINEIEARDVILKGISPRYTCIYGAGKLAAQIMGKTLARNCGMNFCTALIAMPYGEMNQARTLPNIIMEQLIAGRSPKLIEGNGKYDLVYIGDVAKGLALIGEKGLDFKDYYIGHRQLRTFREIMSDIRDYLSPDTKLLFGEYPDAPSVDYTMIDLDSLYRDTGFECTADFKGSILKTAEWLSQKTQNEERTQ